MRTIIFLWLIRLTATAGFSQVNNTYSIIPKPAKLEVRSGQFLITAATTVRIPPDNDDLKAVAGAFVRQLSTAGGLTLTVRETNGAGGGNSPAIVFLPVREDAAGASSLGHEGYRLDVRSDRILIEAAHPNGFFYAVQSLYQLLPPQILSPKRVPSEVAWTVPACRIEDRPRYAYRGLHLDVARHFFPVSFLKKYIDLMALHKLNTFHWHLTDDQGWRIEIKKYPKLTEVGAKRRETLIGHYEDYDPQEFDGKPYGGFYTQDDVREIVRYAQSKYITVVPEIEMPGHSLAALAAYPEFGCTGGPYEVSPRWGIFEDVFCPYEKTFTFLQDVLTEVIDLFPGPYIHIGGDECPKGSWRRSEFCQDLIRREGLKNEHELQSYFITRIDKWVTAKGRKMIGWDEILEGGLSPNATVMSWRGVQGGIAAARQGHDVIMTPSNFLYLDHYQSDPAQEPTAIGGYTPLEETYSYDPTPGNLPEETQKHIIGVQANIWTEYLKTPEQVEYMLWPRAAALAEIGWTPRSEKSWSQFHRRIPVHLRRLDQLSVGYSKAYYDIVAGARTTRDARLQVVLTPKDTTTEIHYTLDGTLPTPASKRYEQPFLVEATSTVKAVAVKDGNVVGKVMTKEFVVSKATGKTYLMALRPKRFKGGDQFALTNGVNGFAGDLNTTVALEASNLQVVLDLGKPQTVQRVSVGFAKITIRNTVLPKAVDIAVSTDGKTFKTVSSRLMNPAQRGKREIVRPVFQFQPVKARYIRVIAQNAGKVPAGLPNAGKNAFVAADEITVD